MTAEAIGTWAAAVVSVLAAIISVVQARSSKRQAIAAEEQTAIMLRQYRADRRDRAEDLHRAETLREAERREQTEVASRTYLLGLLVSMDSIIDILAMPELPSDPEMAREIHRAHTTTVLQTLRAYRPSVVMIDNDDLTVRFRALVELATQLSQRDPQRRSYDDLRNYARYLRYCVRRLSGNEPIPPAEPPPDLSRAGTQPWTPQHVSLATVSDSE